MSRTRMSSAGAVLVVAMAFAVSGPAFAGGPGQTPAADSAFAALAGSQLSTTQLSATRGGAVCAGGLAVASCNTTSVLDESAKSGGTNGGLIVGAYGNGWASNSVNSGSSGIFNQVANTGNLSQINQSMAVFINAQ